VFVPREGVSGPIRTVPSHPSIETASDLEEPPQPDIAPNLYRYPHLYDALKTPAEAEVKLLWELLERYTGPGPWHMLDPACGPGNWLRPFLDGQNTLVGNDFCREMVDWIKSQLDTRSCRAVRGDMYHLGLGAERFDVVFEASGVTSIVPNLAMLSAWIDQLGGYLRPGGAIVLLFNFQSELPDTLPHLLWRTPWQDMPGGGVASLQYELLRDVPERGTQHIQRTVRTHGVSGTPELIQEDYELRVWQPEELRALTASLRTTQLVDVLDAHTGLPLSKAESECYLVFKSLG
jgi:SAM-dependent methyltransferase